MNPASDELNDPIVQAADWTLRLDAAPADAALRAEFERWLDQDAAHRMAFRMVQYTSATIDSGRGVMGDAPKAADVVRPPVDRAPRRVRWLAAGAALAAAFLAFVTFPILQKHILADYVTGVAELREIVLPDGSVAYLDAGSAIAVNYRQDARSITLLSGQAFFDVTRNPERPFHVEADKVSVVVTGTSFGVNRTVDSVSVAVQSGTVEVALAAAGGMSRLSAGERWIYDQKTGVVDRRDVQPANVSSWRSRRLIVHDEKLGDILEEIGRHTPGAIVVRDGSLNRRIVSGVYDLSRPAEALEALLGSQRARVIQITPYLTIVSAH